jgi:hypothetical protein
MKRSPLKRFSRLNPVSESTFVKQRKRRTLRAAFLKKHPWCRVCGNALAVHVHEPWTRGRGGPMDDARNFMGLCQKDHDFIHANPEWAERHGFLIPAHEGKKWLERGGVNQ